MADGWGEHIDEGTGDTFWYHEASGETTWYNPAGWQQLTADDGEVYWYHPDSEETRYTDPDPNHEHGGAEEWHHADAEAGDTAEAAKGDAPASAAGRVDGSSEALEKLQSVVDKQAAQIETLVSQVSQLTAHVAELRAQQADSITREGELAAKVEALAASALPRHSEHDAATKSSSHPSEAVEVPGSSVRRPAREVRPVATIDVSFGKPGSAESRPTKEESPMHPNERVKADARAASPSSPQPASGRLVRRLSRDILAAFDPAIKPGAHVRTLSPVPSEHGSDEETDKYSSKPPLLLPSASGSSVGSTPRSARLMRKLRRGVFAATVADKLTPHSERTSATAVPPSPRLAEEDRLSYIAFEEPGDEARALFEAVSHHFAFQALSAKYLEQLFDMLRCAELKAGGKLFAEGITGTHVYIVESGMLQESVHGVSTGATFGPGNLVGDMSLYYEAPRGTTVTALEDCRLWVMRATEFHDLAQRSDQEQIDARTHWLDNVSLLNPLKPTQKVAVARALDLIEYSDGDIIIKTGDVGDAFYIVQAGDVSCRILRPGSTQWTEVASLGPGHFFGEMALLNDTPRSADVVAKGSVTCLRLARGPFERLLGPLQDILDNEARRRSSSNAEPRTDRLDAGDGSLVATTAAGGTASKLKVAQVDTESGGKPTPFNLDDVTRLGLLGEGSFGIVELVRYQGKPFAMKRLLKHEIVAARQTAHICRERRLLSCVDHPFVVKMGGTTQDPSSVFLLLEFVAGGELWSLVYGDESPLRDAELGGMKEEAARFYVACIVEVLDYLHSRGVAYRDLKPENVLVGPDGFIRMVDFGFSKSIPFRQDGHVVAQSHTFLGSPEYLPPEVVLHKGHDKSVDMWALGVMTYELLMGETPFANENQNQVFKNVCSRDIGRLDVLESRFPEAADLIKLLLDLNPALRLGALHGGVGDVKAHPWLKGVDWSKLRNREVDPPYVPELQSAEDRSHFELAGDEEAELSAAAAAASDPFEGDSSLFSEF